MRRIDNNYSALRHGVGSPGHSHAPPHHDRAFAIGAALNAGFVIAEISLGLIAGSVALLADAAHNLGDVLGLLLAWGAAWLGRKPPTRRRTYGWGRSSILASLVNAVVLLIAVGAIAVEAIRRLTHPTAVTEQIMIWVALAGIVINGASALLFMRGRSADLNVRAAFVHLAADAAVSFGVVLAAALIWLTGWLWVDPVTSLLIVAVLTVTSWGLLRDSMALAMDQVPEGIAQDDVESFLLRQPGVIEVHDLHIWGLSTTSTALTAHLVCAGPPTGSGWLHEISTKLVDRFGIGHSTFQIETDADAAQCRLRSEKVV